MPYSPSLVEVERAAEHHASQLVDLLKNGHFATWSFSRGGFVVIASRISEHVEHAYSQGALIGGAVPPRGFGQGSG